MGTLLLDAANATPASHLSQKERKECVVTARKALDENDMKDTPLCVGTGGMDNSSS